MAAPDISEEAFHLRLGYLKPETLEIARVELRETEEVKAEAIKKLRELLKATPEINYKDDDAFLTIFLRACHFYPESALEKVRTKFEFSADKLLSSTLIVLLIII